VGLSKPRNQRFEGLQLDEELKKRDAEPWCGVQIVSLTNGDVLNWIRFEGDITEIFDISFLPNVRQPDDDRPAHGGDPRADHVRTRNAGAIGGLGMTLGNMKFQILIAASLLLSTAAFAQTATAPAKTGVQAGPDAAFAAWDKDGNGTLSKDEFRAGWMATRNDLVVQRLHGEFERHDADKSGKIEAPNTRSSRSCSAPVQSAPAMSAFDKNKDGGLQFAEYVDFVSTTARQAAGPKPATAAPKTK
jgi:hypothetical protein